MRSRPKIKDVAALADVAASTVSAVLNDPESPRASPETRARILEAARSLGYVPNEIARGLRTQRSMMIGLVSDVIATTPYAGQLIQGAQDAAWAAGYLLLLVNTGGDDELEAAAIAALRQQQVAGVLYATMYHRVVTPPASLAGVPLVMLDARAAADEVPSVIPDERAGARTAVDALAEQGHRRIAFVLDAGESPAGEGRLDGYRSALADRGLPADPRWVVRAASDSDGGHEAGLQLFDLSPDERPTAVFAFNDQMAVGVYRAAADRGLRIPDDLSVIGFDDLYVVARELTPGLTSVALPHYDMGVAAAQIVLESIAAGSRPPGGAPGAGRVVRVACPLVERGSVGPPPSPDAAGPTRGGPR